MKDKTVSQSSSLLTLNRFSNVISYIDQIIIMMKLMINDIHQMIINSENTFKDLDLTHQSTTVDTNCHQTLAKEKKKTNFHS